MNNHNGAVSLWNCVLSTTLAMLLQYSCNTLAILLSPLTIYLLPPVQEEGKATGGFGCSGARALPSTSRLRYGGTPATIHRSAALAPPNDFFPHYHHITARLPAVTGSTRHLLERGREMSKLHRYRPVSSTYITYFHIDRHTSI